MGWKDAPEVGKPTEKKPKWMFAPEVAGQDPTKMGYSGPTAPQPSTPSDKTSFVGGIVKGFRNPLDSLAQTAEETAKLVGINTDAVNKAFNSPSAAQATANAKQGITDFFGAPPSGAGEAVGELLVTAPLAAQAPTFSGRTWGDFARRAGTGFGVGAGFGALQPVENEGPFWEQKFKQVGVGGAGGVAGSFLGSMAGRIINPQSSDAVRLLRNEGVTPTSGQMMGGALKRTEERATSLPIVGDAIEAAQRSAIRDFNRAAHNRVLAPLNVRLPEDVPVGRDAIRHVGDLLDQRYNAALNRITGGIRMDAQFNTDMNTLTTMAQTLHPARQQQFSAIINNAVNRHFTNSGNASIASFKAAEAELGYQIRQYLHSQDPDARALGSALREAQAILRQLVERQNPVVGREIRELNTAWANWVRVETAAARQGAREGIFTPEQLASSVRQNDRTLRHGSYAAGRALMEDLSDAGVNVLGRTYPDSGTTGRAILGTLAAGGGAAIHPGSLVAAGMATIPYLPGFRNVMPYLLGSRPAGALTLADIVRNTGGIVGGPAGAALAE